MLFLRALTSELAKDRPGYIVAHDQQSPAGARRGRQGIAPARNRTALAKPLVR